MKRFWCWLRGYHRFRSDDQLEHFWHCDTCRKRNMVPNTQ